MAMLSMTIGTMAENLTVANVVLPQNGTIEIEIGLTNPTSVYESFSLELNLPNGVVPVMASNGYPDFTLGTRFTGLTTGYKDGNIATYGHLTDGNAITGTSGKLFAAKVRVDGEVQVGTVLNATISNIKFTTTGLVNEILDDVNFTITIGEPVDERTVLDETSTTAPTAASGVDVRVLRTINANEWSTICLPFAMTAEQVTAAFGDDVELGDFTGYEYDEDNDKIAVNFTDATAMAANHPYIIKVSKAVSEILVDGVDIDPSDDPRVSYKSGKKLKDFVGTYVANFNFYDAAKNTPLFLSGNQFWYATENTQFMKAYRAYFDFNDELENPTSTSRISLSFDETTAIKDVKTISDDKVYNLSGQQVKNPAKGIYVKDGKKVIIK